jgi:hypothetical protein
VIEDFYDLLIGEYEVRSTKYDLVRDLSLAIDDSRFTIYD